MRWWRSPRANGTKPRPQPSPRPPGRQRRGPRSGPTRVKKPAYAVPRLNWTVWGWVICRGGGVGAGCSSPVDEGNDSHRCRPGRLCPRPLSLGMYARRRSPRDEREGFCHSPLVASPSCSLAVEILDRCGLVVHDSGDVTAATSRVESGTTEVSVLEVRDARAAVGSRRDPVVPVGLAFSVPPIAVIGVGVSQLARRGREIDPAGSFSGHRRLS